MYYDLRFNGSNIFQVVREMWPPRSPDLSPADFFLWTNQIHELWTT